MPAPSLHCLTRHQRRRAPRFASRGRCLLLRASGLQAGAMALQLQTQLQRSTITLKGSAQIVSQYFEYAVQRYGVASTAAA